MRSKYLVAEEEWEPEQEQEVMQGFRFVVQNQQLD